MRSSVQKNQKTFLFPLIGIGLSVLFFLFNNLGWLNWLRNGISFVFEPISYVATNAGTSVYEYFNTFTKIPEFNAEHNELRTRVLELEGKLAGYSLLVEENASLKAESKVADSEGSYVMAEVVSDPDPDFLRLNRGSGDDVSVGDIVSVGNMYVGMVVSVDANGSQVRLPTSTSSHLESVIVRADLENISGSPVLSKAVVSGSPEGVKIENIVMNADIKDGDVVVVNDERVGGLLVLGYLVNLSDNPATTSRFGYVASLADYDDLLKVFIRID